MNNQMYWALAPWGYLKQQIIVFKHILWNVLISIIVLFFHFYQFIFQELFYTVVITEWNNCISHSYWLILNDDNVLIPAEVFVHFWQ